MKYMTLPVKKLTEHAIPPTYSHDGDAGLDLYASENMLIFNESTSLVKTGIAIDIPLGYAGFIHPRSGLAMQHGLTVLNAPGTVDAGYRGEICVLIHNTASANDVDDHYRINRGDRIAQLIIQEVTYACIKEVESFEGFTSRETAGFGSTGS